MCTMFTLAFTTIVTGCNTSNNNESGSDTYAFTTDKIKVGQYKGITVEFEEPTNEEIENVIDSQQESFLSGLSEYEKVTDRAAKLGDRVNIDYEGLKDGVAFDNGTATGQAIVLGSSGYIDGFDDGIIGMKTGDKKDLNLTFPDPYEKNPDLAGKDVVFKVKLNYIEENKVTELTDELVEKNSEYKTIEEYREGTRKSYLEYIESSKMNAAWSQVINNSKVDEYPKDELEMTKQEIENSYSSTASMYGMTVDDYLTQVQGATVEEYAKDTITSQYLVQAIGEKEKLTVSDDEYKAGVTKYTEEYKYESEEAFIEAITEEKFREFLLSEKVASFVKDNAKFTAPKETNVPTATENTENNTSKDDTDEVVVGDEDKE